MDVLDSYRGVPKGDHRYVIDSSIEPRGGISYAFEIDYGRHSL